MPNGQQYYEDVEQTPYTPIPFDMLGSGSSALVFRAKRKSEPHEIYALKLVRLRGDKNKQNALVKDMQQEVEIIKSVQHVHIVRIIDSYRYPGYYSIVLDPVADIDLARYMFESSEYETDKLRVPIPRWIGCLINGLAFLHDRHIRHRDIKPGNILVKQENILIADFGIAAISEDGSTTAAAVPRARTRTYCAPEVEKGGTRKRLADIYSLGAVLLDMSLFYTGQRELARTLLENLDSIHVERQELLKSLWDVGWKKEPWEFGLLCLCENMLKSERDHRPNASDARLCWSYIRDLTDLSASCECIESTQRLSDATVSSAGNKLIIETLRQPEYATLQHNQQTAMHIAAKSGHRNIMKLLIDEGSELNPKDKSGMAPLSWAAEQGHESVVRLLLEKGAEINLEEGDHTSLRRAIEKGHTSVALLLLDGQLERAGVRERQLQATVDEMRAIIDHLEMDRGGLSTMLESLNEENATLKLDNQEQEKQLQSVPEDTRQIIDGLENERERLSKILHSLGEARDPKSWKGDRFFIDSFRQLRSLIVDVSKENSFLIGGNPPKDVLIKIPPAIPSFLDNTAASQELRAAYIQHVISASLTDRIFRPFLFTLGPRHEKTDLLFQKMSSDIRRKSVYRESFWRRQTLKAAYTTSDAKVSINVVAAIIVDEIFNHIKHFADPSRLDALLTGIRRIVKLAAETWRHARVERELVIATMLTPESDAVWNSMWEEYTSGSSVDCRKSSDSSPQVLLRLFPCIYREACDEKYFFADPEKANLCVYSPGVVLLSDSPSVLARNDECLDSPPDLNNLSDSM